MLYRDPYWNNYGKKEDRKEEDGCVKINIWCGEQEDHKKDGKPCSQAEFDREPSPKEEHVKKCDDKNECRCVVINIFCDKKEEPCKDPRPQQP